VEKILDEMAVNYELELKETKKLRKEILDKSREEARVMLLGVNKAIENTISEIRKSQAEKEKTKEAREKLEQLKAEMSDSTYSDPLIDAKIEKLREKEQRRNERRPVEEAKSIPVEILEERMELKSGDKVRLAGQSTIGDVIELNEKNVVVAFGQLITTLPRAQVERLSNNEAIKISKSTGYKKSPISGDFSQRRLLFKPDIDIRGKRVEEALSIIQIFIDEAIMFEVSQLRILHGKGNGILKETIRGYLRSEPMVKSFKDEHVDFGGAGITVVNLAM
jgi:DNA mismatch repair protein MutS2